MTSTASSGTAARADFGELDSTELAEVSRVEPVTRVGDAPLGPLPYDVIPLVSAMKAVSRLISSSLSIVSL
jgi:hypothetical protein